MARTTITACRSPGRQTWQESERERERVQLARLKANVALRCRANKTGEHFNLVAVGGRLDCRVGSTKFENSEELIIPGIWLTIATEQ